MVSVSGSTSSTQGEWTGAKEAGGVSRSRGQRDHGAARCRGAAVPRRDRRRAGNLALAGNATATARCNLNRSPVYGERTRTVHH